MMEFLQSAWEAYAAWRSAPVEVYMGLPPAIAAALIVGGSTLLNSQLNKPSGATKSAERAGADLSRAQADEVARQTEARAFLEALLRGELDGEIDPSVLFQFPDAAGGPALDRETLLAQLTAGNRGAMLDRLLGLAGAGSLGQGGAVAGLNAGATANALGNQSTQQTLQNIALQLLTQRSGPQPVNQAANTPGNQGITVGPAGPSQRLF